VAVCVDTPFLVDLLAGAPSAVDFAEGLQEPAAISAVSFYELLFGFRVVAVGCKLRTSPGGYAVVPADYEVCTMAAAIQGRLGEAGELIPVLDAIIAATAILAGLPVVTSDAHFRRIPPDFGLAVRAY